MRFQLIDKIHHCEPGKFLRAAKFLALGEEYLADHFPRFPVMPGVLMLEALVESAAWLWRATSKFEHTVIVLREVRNVKYGNFMQPGHRLDMAVSWVKVDGGNVVFRGTGTNEAGETNVSAQFTLHGYSLSNRGPAGVAADAKLKAHWQERWALLTVLQAKV
jgi:3-hydroxyacyl-[acyl-carrier-protein] dehydratase